ncbi:putative integral membrane protein [Babesia bovis T2Bo]|uniref:Uncharacterized protein n=1 Tax=Babesia bovis TaxID=5865 RepID=A7AU56_BABBO|nr:putative integral membrane protein [Babesia bovis T2Bo]EDO06467.1 putative integral membrane protein [Babesia bovis T2Bo]|eukprot:XP_001610035.1 hypothetical protein [Babesia bovis T2Bo]
MGLWGYGFTRESKRARATRRYGAFYLCSMFLLPSFIWYCFGNPAVTGWFIKRAIPITYPPESNPRVISRIYHDKSDGNNQKSKE